MGERLITGFNFLAEVLYSPETAFGRRRAAPTIFVPLVVLGLACAILSSLQAPLQIRWTEAQLLTAGTPPEQIASQMESLRTSNVIGIFVAPLLLMLRWTAFALILWLTGLLVLDQLEFSQTLGIVAYSYFPILIRDAANYLVLSLRDAETLERPDGMRAALGLNLIFPSLPRPWEVLAANLNIFEVWYGVLLVIGIAATTRSPWTKALATVLPVWLFIVLIQAGLASLGLSLQHQLAH